MARNERIKLISREEYLKREAQSTQRNEYVRGLVFAMTGATEAHNLICTNLLVPLHQALSGTPCRVYVSDMKVLAVAADCFYYPDIMVTCEPFVADSVYKTAPVLLVEVLSRSTKSTDRREKLAAYQQIESLQHYVIVHQNRMQVDVYSRCSSDQWDRISLHKTGLLELTVCPDKRLEIVVADIYNGLDFNSVVREPEEEEYELV